MKGVGDIPGTLKLTANAPEAMDGWNTFSFHFRMAYFQVLLLLVSGSVPCFSLHSFPFFGRRLTGFPNFCPFTSSDLPRFCCSWSDLGFAAFKAGPLVICNSLGMTHPSCRNGE